MALPRPGYDELIARHEQAHREALRATRRDLVRSCATLVFWVACGWVLIGFSARTTDVGLGWVLYWAGVCVWIPGVLFSLLGAYRRGEERGDW